MFVASVGGRLKGISIMHLIKAEIVYSAGKKFPSQYGGDRQNIKVRLPDRSEHCVWFDAGMFNHLAKGQTIDLVSDGGKLKIVEEVSPSYVKTPGTTAPAAAPSAANFESYVDRCSRIYGYCLRKARIDFPNESESVQLAIAQGIFQQTISKFGDVS